MKKLFEILTGGLLGQVGTIVDNVVTTEAERKQLDILLAKAVKEHAFKLLQLQQDMVKAELTGNWMQRSWRPILMLSFGFIVMYSKFIAPAFDLPNTELEPQFWYLLEIGVGGYVVGRSAEKIAPYIGNKQIQ